MTDAQFYPAGGGGVRYLSVCSGIEAATVAWAPLGWEAAAFSEIDRFPRAVLKHHYPSVPLHGDFTTIKGDEYGPVDLLVGGTPCQSFSVAGLRKGLDDERGNLALGYLELAARLNARWLVWENVPGVLSSNGGRDFGAFLGGLAELGYGWAYRVLDAQHFGVPQRRRRVFVVGYLGDWRRAAAVLFERHSLQGHPPPRREAGERTARRAGGGVAFGIGSHAGAADATVSNDNHANGGPSGMGISEELAHSLRAGRTTAIAHVPDVAHALTCHMVKGGDPTTGNYVAHTLRADGFDASEDGTGRGTPLVPTFAIQERAVCENPDAGPDGAGFRGDGVAYTLEARTQQQAIAFSCKDYGADAGDTAPTMRAMGHHGSHANAGGQVAVAFAENSRAELRLEGGDGQRTGALSTVGGKPGQGVPMVAAPMAVRRITPVEAERLQGFSDNYTRIPYRGKPAEACPDGPRYKALGNSMAVPVMRWIGERIQMVEAIARDAARRVA